MPHSVDDDFGVSVHALVPLHDLVMQAVDVQVTPVPWQAPPEQRSPYVHGFPSSQAGIGVQPQPLTGSSRQKYSVPPQLRASHSEFVNSSQV